ncbi:MAG: efflux RND transporter periplasmic adaptor subunit [Treponema sp.]|jgi:multidrug efflux pump subunit AcrA (membrane-fusion protein)|nr:efflux RND transporter periplasmic adaptor subunit [Treponema sp.]
MKTSLSAFCRTKKTRAAAIATGAFFTAVSIFSSCGKKAEAEAAPAREVKAAVALVRELSDETGGFGTLSFLAKFDVSSSQEGTVKDLPFREGDAVRRGETLARLENPQLILAVGRAENAYAQAAAALDLARSRLVDGGLQAEAEILSIEKTEAELAQAGRVLEEDRRRHEDTEKLYEAGGLAEETMRERRFALQSSEEQLRLMERELEIRRVGFRDEDLAGAGEIPEDRAARIRALIFLRTAGLRAELDAAAAYLDAAAKELESARLAESELMVRSPGSGIVGARYFEEGERLARGDKILTLMDTSSLYALFPLRESDALRLERGMPASVGIDGTGGNHEGRVDLVYPQADSQSMSFLVRVLLTGAAGLSPGMFARVRIPLGSPRRALVVPESAVAGNRNGEGTVFVIKGNHLSERKVTLGTSAGEEREILSGLAPGEVVAVRPESDLGEGDYVTAVE